MRCRHSPRSARSGSICSRRMACDVNERTPVMDAWPIGDYALLSDCHSGALVSRSGSVDWLCFPRFDASAVFARILDPDGGHFAIGPDGEFEARRAYVDQTMVLETTFVTASGTAVLTDAMAVGRNERGHDLGAKSRGVLVRRLVCTDGEMEVEVSYAPRPEYGLIHPILEAVPGGLTARGGASRLFLSAPASFRVEEATATAHLHLAAGQGVMFALQHARMGDPPLAAWGAGPVEGRGGGTGGGWGERGGREGGRGRRSARPMTVPGGTWSFTLAGCCRP